MKALKLLLKILLILFSLALIGIMTYVIVTVQPKLITHWISDDPEAAASALCPANIEFLSSGICLQDGQSVDYRILGGRVRINGCMFDYSCNRDQLTLVGESGSAAYTSCGSSERYEYTIKDGEAEITQNDDNTSWIAVADEFEGCPVTRIGDSAFASENTIVRIDLPDTLTAIGDYAFFFCSHLEEIVLPESLKMIGENAFSNCTSLKCVVLPYGIEQIGDNAFSGCTALKEVVYPDGTACTIADFAH
ncbi:MAG TPA: leucine-rich repeat domain-containing protein [Candidatus Cryosericum sp.]|nr:leucine-rich repeat domain-containing protein [Candidatus Cryosericum sp.]